MAPPCPALGLRCPLDVSDGLDVSVVERTLSDNDSIDPVVDLILHASGHIVRVSIGVGPDATIARTILHSLHES